MPKKSVFECSCDRCGRVWYEESEKALAPGETSRQPGSSFKLELNLADGKVTKVVYELMCESCAKAVANYVTNIARDLKATSGAKKGASDKDTPPAPPPNKKKVTS